MRKKSPKPKGAPKGAPVPRPPYPDGEYEPPADLREDDDHRRPEILKPLDETTD